MRGTWAAVLAVIWGCSGAPAGAPGQDAAADAAQPIRDGGGGTLPDGRPVALVELGPDRDGGQHGRDADRADAARELDAAQVVADAAQDTGLVCLAPLVECGAECWDPCGAIAFLNSKNCATCDGAEICGCGPAVMFREGKCVFDCQVQ